MLKTALAILALLALPASAGAAPKAKYSEATLCQVLLPCLPPARFAQGPFLEQPLVRDVTLHQIQSICSNGHGGGELMGCATFENGRCVVHVPADLKATVPELYDIVLRHELGHCRGWTHDDFTVASQ